MEFFSNKNGEEDLGTYEIDIECTNCGEYGTEEIPMKKTVKDYFASNKSECLNCGCLTVQPMSKENKEKEEYY